jgi:hypothetical protein
MFEFNETDKTMWNNGKANIISNTSYGDGALIGSSAGTTNTAIGYRSMFSNSFFAASNTALGAFSLTANTTGNSNTAIGTQSLISNTTGSNNVAVGDVSGQTWSNISNSVFIGYQTSAQGENQTNQIVIGSGATGHGSNTVTLGNGNITTTVLRANVGIGNVNPNSPLDILSNVSARGLNIRNRSSNDLANIMFSTNNASADNAAIGWITGRLRFMSGGSGDASERLSILTNGNVGIGTTSPKYPFHLHNASGAADVRFALTDGSTTDAIDRGFAMIKGIDQNSFLWNYSNTFMAFGTNATERIRIAANGNVGIGTTNTNGRLRVLDSGVFTGLSFPFEFASSNTSLSGWLFAITNNNTSGLLLGTRSGSAIIGTLGPSNLTFNPDGGSVTVGSLGTGTVFSNAGVLTNTNPSDERLKENIDDLEYGLNEILQLRPVSYNWINDTANQGKQFGFIAQEVQEVMPDLINEFTITKDEEEVVRLGLDKEAIFVAMVNAIKEQNEVLVQLKAEIDLLKQKA